MKQQTPRRKVVALAMAPAAFALGVLVAVLVASSASAQSPLPTSTGSTAGTTTTSTTGSFTGGFDQNSPQAQFLVINGTVNATSDHEIVGSSAFPNYTTGAVDNYYSLARSYMDNSPFSEATASPADTGPVGQTAAAGNTQQPQYADARWPGGPDTATYGTSGQPFADAGAYEQLARAKASEASNGLSSPGLGGSKTLPVPKGFDTKLQQALADWKSKYLGCPTVPQTSKPPLPTVSTPAITIPSVKTPTTTVTTPLGTVTTPSTPSIPSVSTPSTRSLSTATTTCSSSSGSGGSDGESLLESSSLAVLVPGTADTNQDIDKVDTSKLETTPATTTTDTTQTAPTTTGTGAWNPKPYTLMMSGSSSVGRVTLGGGQIVIKGISVDASVENDGTATPTYKANVTVASASIGGVPVTIDQDGVHVASQNQALPYKQASDSLNGALKQAGIQIFLVAPQVTNCDQSGSGTSTSATTTTTSTDTTSTDQSGTAGPCAQTGAVGGSCSSTDTGTDTTSTYSSTSPSTTTTTSTPTPPLPAGSGGTDTTSTTPPACPPPSTSCDTGTTSTGNTTTTGHTTTGTAPATPTIGGSTTNSTTTSPTSTTDTTSIGPSSCSAPPTSCPSTATGTTSTTTTSTDTTATAGAPNPMGGGAANAGQETIVMATGVHIVFTQPVSPSGVPAQFVEHILGEVFMDSLAAPAAPLPAITPYGASGSSSPCAGGTHSKSSRKSTGGGSSSSSSGSSPAGGSSGGGTLGSSSGASSLSPAGSSYAASSQPGSGGNSQSLPAVFARALKKPLWLLLAYLVWQLLVIGTGWSLWNWRRGGEPT